MVAIGLNTESFLKGVFFVTGILRLVLELGSFTTVVVLVRNWSCFLWAYLSVRV